MMRLRLAIGAATAAAALCGCSEPTDCRAEPERCLRPANAVANTLPNFRQAALQAARGAEPANTNNQLRVAPQPVQGPANGAMALPPHGRVAMAPSDTMAARGRPQPEAGAGDGKPSAADPHIGEYRALLAAALEPIKKRDVAALTALCSPRMADTLKTIMVANADRFWRHLDRYPGVIASSSLSITTEPGEVDRTQLVVRSDGAELKPIVLQVGGQWRFDRF